MRDKVKHRWQIQMLCFAMLLFISGFSAEYVTAQPVTDNTHQAVKTARLTEQILHIAPVGIGTLDDRVIAMVNNYIAELLGYSQTELIGQNIQILYPSNVREKGFREIPDHPVDLMETVLRHKDGTLRNVVVSSRSLNATDITANIVFTVQKITESRPSAEIQEQGSSRFWVVLTVLVLLLVVSVIFFRSWNKHKEAGQMRPGLGHIREPNSSRIGSVPHRPEKPQGKAQPHASVKRSPAPPVAVKPENYILTIAVSDTETELLSTLKTGEAFAAETAERLFKAREWIHYRSEDVWNRDCKSLFDSRPADEDNRNGSVCYVKITTGVGEDVRFGRSSNMMKMYDALKELFQPGSKIDISVSEPRSRRTYENKGFYRV